MTSILIITKGLPIERITRMLTDFFLLHEKNEKKGAKFV